MNVRKCGERKLMGCGAVLDVCVNIKLVNSDNVRINVAVRLGMARHAVGSPYAETV